MEQTIFYDDYNASGNSAKCGLSSLDLGVIQAKGDRPRVAWYTDRGRCADLVGALQELGYNGYATKVSNFVSSSNGSTTPPPTTKKTPPPTFESSIPLWAWITGGVVLVGGIITTIVMTTKKGK